MKVTSLSVALLLLSSASALKGDKNHNEQQQKRQHRKLAKQGDIYGYYTYSKGRGGVSKFRDITTNGEYEIPDGFPSTVPSDEPSAPSPGPSIEASQLPSFEPSTSFPSASPSTSPSTPKPSPQPSSSPSTNPTSSPSISFAPTPHVYRYDDEPRVYNRVGANYWPSDSVWQNELGRHLSPSARLISHLDITDNSYYNDLCSWGDAFDWIMGGDGICVITDGCQYRYCNRDGRQVLDTPAYSVDVRNEADISRAFEFANKWNIQVTIKTTGHNFVGASTGKDSLNIWMTHYPKDGTVTKFFQDSCGTVTDTVMSINGGELWNDVFESAKRDYHVLSGDTRSVSAAGGWLQGVGLSHTCRQYGLGIDNVVRFEVVVPSGELLVADACENSDLFWALRGGGGGTFGVVTNVQYKMHPPTKVTSIVIDIERERWEAALLFLTWWAEITPFLDNHVAGAWFGPNFAEIFIVGDQNFAFSGEFINMAENFFVERIWEQGYDGDYYVTHHDSWYDAMGGEEGPDDFGDACRYCEGNDQISTRLVPEQMVLDDPDGMVGILLELFTDHGGFGAYWLGGVVNDVDPDTTAVHPAMRSAIWGVSTTTRSGASFVRRFFGNDVSGCSFNHHSVAEPEWRTALWGDDHYRKLLGIKNRYDPTRRLNCWHCVGYQGEEYQEF